MSASIRPRPQRGLEFPWTPAPPGPLQWASTRCAAAAPTLCGHHDGRTGIDRTATCDGGRKLTSTPRTVWVRKRSQTAHLGKLCFRVMEEQ
nr:ricin-type beta-trefoil lectin domain protein [Streptomyces sp.]